jgi:hypothetical protein
MRRGFVIATVILLGCGPLQAQSVMPQASVMLPTSPLGMPGMSNSTGIIGLTGTTFPTTGSTGTGIPMGATEINPGGLSPMLGGCGTTFGGITSGSGMNGGMSGSTMSTSGGMIGSMSGCTTGSTTAISGGVSSGAAVPSLGTRGSTVRPTGVPFGSTEIGSGGVSPMLTVPPPAMTPPCLGAITPAVRTQLPATGSTTMPPLTSVC